jgi:hypothetical protein
MSVMQGQETLQPYTTQPPTETQRIELGPRIIGERERKATPANVRHTEILITKDTLTTINQNKAHGHSIYTKPADTTLRIYHQNIRGAKTYQNWNRWKEGVQQLTHWGVGIATLVETNTQWTTINKSAAQAMTHSVTSQSKLSMTGSIEQSESDFQPGGTACVALGKWTGRITTRLTDDSGLGRWSGFHIQGKNQKSVVVISAYRPTNSSDPSDRTSHSQQWRILRGRNITKPNPRKAFIEYLTKEIQKWKEEGNEIIIGLDANESLIGNHSQIRQLIQDTNLELLVDTATPPATFARGTQPIDFILGTMAIKQATIANGDLPFYAGAWDSDHRALFIDVNVDTLLGGIEEIDQQPKRSLQSSNKIVARRFLTNLGRDKNLTELHQSLIALKQKRELTTADKQRLYRSTVYKSTSDRRKEVQKQPQ